MPERIVRAPGQLPHEMFSHSTQGKYVSAAIAAVLTMRPTIPRSRTMIDHYHVAVWLDHSEARVFGIGREDAEQQVIRTHSHQRNLHHKANSRDSGHVPVDREFFERIAESLKGAGALLLTGPASAKTEFATFLREHHPHIAGRVSAVEPLDHPSDGMLIALARKFFRADDRMR
jgi:hypothetical protein